MYVCIYRPIHICKYICVKLFHMKIRIQKLYSCIHHTQSFEYIHTCDLRESKVNAQGPNLLIIESIQVF